MSHQHSAISQRGQQDSPASWWSHLNWPVLQGSCQVKPISHRNHLYITICWRSQCGSCVSKSSYTPCPPSAISPAAACVPAAVRDDKAPVTHTCWVDLGPTECQSKPAVVMSAPAGPALAGTSGSSEVFAVFPTIYTMPWFTQSKQTVFCNQAEKKTYDSTVTQVPLRTLSWKFIYNNFASDSAGQSATLCALQIHLLSTYTADCIWRRMEKITLLGK